MSEAPATPLPPRFARELFIRDFPCRPTSLFAICRSVKKVKTCFLRHRTVLPHRLGWYPDRRLRRRKPHGAKSARLCTLPACPVQICRLWARRSMREKSGPSWDEPTPWARRPGLDGCPFAAHRGQNRLHRVLVHRVPAGLNKLKNERLSVYENESRR